MNKKEKIEQHRQILLNTFQRVGEMGFDRLSKELAVASATLSFKGKKLGLYARALRSLVKQGVIVFRKTGRTFLFRINEHQLNEVPYSVPESHPTHQSNKERRLLNYYNSIINILKDYPAGLHKGKIANGLGIHASGLTIKTDKTNPAAVSLKRLVDEGKVIHMEDGERNGRYVLVLDKLPEGMHKEDFVQKPLEKNPFHKYSPMGFNQFMKEFFDYQLKERTQELENKFLLEKKAFLETVKILQQHKDALEKVEANRFYWENEAKRLKTELDKKECQDALPWLKTSNPV